LVLGGLLGAIRMARHEELSGVGVAAAAGLLGLLAMAMVDFPLQIPATALLLMLLLFLPAALRRENPELPPISPKARLLAGVPALVAAAVLIALAVASHVEARKLPGGVSRLNHAAKEGSRLLDEGKSKEALALLTTARDAHPFDGTVRYYLARALYTRGKFEAAGHELEAAFHLARGRGELLFRTGSMAFRMDLPFALPALKEAGALVPKHFTTALNSLPAEFVPDVVPERPFAYMQLGKWHRNRGENDLALEAFWKGYDLSEGRSLTANLTKLYRQLDREEEGRREFEKRGATWPD
jgi:tetratricopeptide (TPR) repeat protein